MRPMVLRSALPIVLAGATIGTAAILLGHSFEASASPAPSYQQGPRLVGTDAVGASHQGSVALSADGNTAIVGGYNDNGAVGAAWVYTRSGGVWSQQGSKLVGSDAVGSAGQGESVALSADGNTAIVGGNRDNNLAGAAWVYTRSAGVWSQQGAKLVGTGAINPADQGASVALSADGNTAVVGGPPDNNFTGAVWVYTRSDGVWSQQGAKLVGTGVTGYTQQGLSVALSEDGNTAIEGGLGSEAAWVFTRSGGVWSQQGPELVGTDAVAITQYGVSVALSGDGNTAMVGGHCDNNCAGAAWVFTRSGGVWSQQGAKLVGTGGVGVAIQGGSVALSADGYTALVGGDYDDSGVGAAWVFIDPAVDLVIPGTTNVPAVFMAAPSPNPASHATTIRFGLPRDATVGLGIYDVAGRKVRELASEALAAGVHTLNWDLRDSAGRPVKGGLYLVRLDADGTTLADHLVVVR